MPKAVKVIDKEGCVRKLVIMLLIAVAVVTVVPASASAAIAGGTAQFVPIGGSDAPPTDANGNGILDAGDYLVVDDILQVDASSLAPVPVGTIATLEGILTIQSSGLVRANLRLSLPGGSLRVTGWFSAAVFEGSSTTFALMTAGRAGIFSRANGQLHVSTGPTTTFSLVLWPFSYLGSQLTR
jgi:hypothetical protein